MIAWMIQHLEVPNTAHWDTAHEGWSVLSHTYHHRYSGCMARLIDCSALLAAMLPELRARWRNSLAQWEGEITLAVGQDIATLGITGRDIRLVSSQGAPARIQARIQMTPQLLTQVVFGYHPISAIVREQALAHADEMLAILAHIFPTGHTWIAGSDWP
jgi:hypothetical protein